MADESNNQKPTDKRAWQPMKLEHVGDLRQIVQGGGGKLSPTGTDPGEIRKTKGHA